MKARPLVLALLLASAASPLLAENEIGYIERFALAADREKVLGELVPGSEDYYFFHALHYQNTRDAARLADILAQWRKRFPDESPRRRVIENREALLGYDASPQATIAYLTEQLHIRHDHQQETRDQKPDLPTSLDPGRIARTVFLARSLANESGLQGFSQEALAALVRDGVPLPPHQQRALLQKLERPDVPGLVEFVATSLRLKESRGFGEFAIHRALLPEHLDELQKLLPEIVDHQAFVHTRLRKLAPSEDVSLEFDSAEREAWLDRVWAYAQTLPPAYNSLKSRILYLRLDHDRKKGLYDRARFLEYLKLPRQMGYVNPLWIKEALNDRQPLCDLNVDLSDPLLSAPPVGNDEALVRDYFLRLFAAGAQNDNPDAALAPWILYVRDTWLKPVFAEAMIVNGIGNAERWASLLTPSAFQQLKERVDIDFPSTNAPFFLPGDDIQFDVMVKNTPKLIVKIFELNTLNFFQTQQRQLNTDLNLDGLVANSEQTHAFEVGPFKRTRQTFQFPDLKGRRGAWIIEFIGGGRSSRALVRVGQWKILQQTGPTGDLLLVLDEKNQPVPEAVAWLDGRKLVNDEKLHRIVAPFTSQPGTKPLIVGDAAGTFATLTQIERHSEEYRLDAQFHIEREQLLAGREATIAIRTALMVGDTHLAPGLLSEPKLSITSTTLDEISTTREVKGLALSAGSVLTHTFRVPERLAKLSVTFTAQAEMLSAGGEKREVTATHTWTVNGMDLTEAVSDGHLSQFGDRHIFELLGKNGETVQDQQVVFTFRHREFTRGLTIPLRTDEKGRVDLGTLPDIAEVTAKCANGRASTWKLTSEEHTFTSTLHTRGGETVRVPASTRANSAVSLLSVRAGTFVGDLHASVTQRDGFYVIDGLAPGDYSLRIAGEPRVITLKVTSGAPMSGWLLGQHRQLEEKNSAPLQIAGIETDKDFVTVKLANSSPFARVHVAATRFEPGTGLFGGLAGFTRFGAASGTPARLPNLYSEGREIGDEYRYILERRYAKAYPGNMLTRPGLLLNPWETRDTDLQKLDQDAGQVAGMTRGGRGGTMVAPVMENPVPQEPGAQGSAQDTNLDFLAHSAPVIYNLVPDKDGVVRVERKALGDRQHVQVYAEDLQNASWRSFALPETRTGFADQRLGQNLDPAKPFTQRKEVTVLEQGKSLTLADTQTSEFETYDTLGSVYSLFTTLGNDENLAKFAFVLQWPRLSDEEKRAKYGEFACHELNFFLSRKDKAFFDAVVKPYLANKKDKTFMDDYLLARDLSRYLEPWAYSRLNVAERCLLAQRIEGEAPNAARHLRELWEMIPPDLEEQDRLCETALRGRALETTSSDADVASEAYGATASAGAYLAEKSQRIIFPEVRFQNATLEEAIEFLRAKTQVYDTMERDPSKKGVNIIIKPGLEPSSARINLDLKDVPLSEALKYVTELAGMKYRVEPYAIVVQSLADSSTTMYTRSYRVPPDFLRKLGAQTAVEALKAQGISFPEGASASYAAPLSKLVVTNTAVALDMVEALIAEVETLPRGANMKRLGRSPAATPASDPFAPPAPAPAAPPALMAKRRSMTADEIGALAGKPASAASKDSYKADRELAENRSLAMGGAVTLAGSAEGAAGADAPAQPPGYLHRLQYFGDAAADDARRAYRALFRALGPTKEWAENNYYELRMESQDADLITVNAFWRDYAAWLAAGARGAFVSPNVAEAARNFPEMMLALGVLDLPFDAPKHTRKTEGQQLTLTAGGPVIVYHKEIKPAEESRRPVPGLAPESKDVAPREEGQPLLLVAQSFFRQSDRYRKEGNEQFEKYVTGEFLIGVVYGANVVVTNPTSAPVKGTVLVQIPQGALPALGTKVTDSRQVRLEPYTTQTLEQYFYFPEVPAQAGAKFAHFPVNVATATAATSAKPFEFNVVARLTQFDKASWDYVSQYGTAAEVFAFLDQNNLESLDLERVAWRCRQSVDFYKKLIATLRIHHVWSDPIATYALYHDDAATLREWLKHRDDFLAACGPFLASKLITIDPIERRSYEHLEYSPLVNQRAHRLGGEWRIANPAVREEYQALLNILAHKPALDAIDNLSVAYFLFLQDRVDEALTRFKGIDAAALPTRLQYDYLTCYADFYEGDLAGARGIAAKYADFSVPRWKTLFASVRSQLDEIDGGTATPEKSDKPDREKQQSQLAATEPGFEFKVENRTVSLSWKNLADVTVNYYLMDPEFSFSSSPFVSQDASRFSIIKPNKSAIQALPKDKDSLDVPLPGEYAKANVLVEVIGAGQRKTQAYHANTLKLALTENYGRLEARDSATSKPLPKTYVKVYARLDDGSLRFFKDGYTDLRGRFDYASLNGGSGAGDPGVPSPSSGTPQNGLDYQMLKPAELGRVQKLAVLVLSDTNGAMVKEVNPPQL